MSKDNPQEFYAELLGSRENSTSENATQAVGLQTEQIQFTGTGGEYFRIWIVNLLLTLLTLGIYSPWAKVRRLQYFYRNTQLAGSGFDYHGQPAAILKGRLIAGVLLFGLFFSSDFSVKLFLGLLATTLAVLPWLIRSAMRFRQRNSSWRGVRFSFHGSLGRAYVIFLLWFPLAAWIGLLWPSFRQRFKNWQIGNSRFGRAPFAFSGTTGDFWVAAFKIGFSALALFILVAGLVIPAVKDVAGGMAERVTPGLLSKDNIGTLFALLFFAVFFPFILGVQQAVMQNLAWNNTTLGPHRFRSDLGVGRMIWVHVSNAVMIVLTLGFFTPWAKVRVARERLSGLQLEPGAALDGFAAAELQQAEAAGDEVADSLDELLDLDLGW